MENLYNHPSVKKFIREAKNPSFDKTKIKLNTRTLVDGGSGSGKTNSVVNFIMRSDDTYEQIVVINRGVEEPLYECLRDKLEKKGKITFFTVDTYPDAQALYDTMVNPADQYLVIFDDMIADLNSKQQISKLLQYFIYGRKLNMTLFFLTQAYFKVPKEVRLNFNYLIILKLSSSKDLKLILSDLTLGVTKEQLCEMYRIATTGKMNFLKIDIETADPNEKFTRNFTDEFHVESRTNAEGEEIPIVSAGSWYRPQLDYNAPRKRKQQEMDFQYVPKRNKF